MRLQKNRLSEVNRRTLEDFSQDSSRSPKEVRRALAILMLNENIEIKLLERLTGYSRQHAYKLEKKYLKKGLQGIEVPKKDPKKLLTKNQIKFVVKMLYESTPQDYGYKTEFWDTAILGNIIYEQYGVKYKSRKPIYLLFKEAKFTFHKPGSKYQPRDQKRVDEWCKDTKKELKTLLNKPDTVVLVEDEMMFLTQTTFQKIWLPIGKYPKVDISVTRKRRCIYGFLNVQTGKEHAFSFQGANTKETIKAVKKIGELYKDRTIVILWDNASWHKSNEFKMFLRETKYRFHLINFPPYAPDLNPQEHVWKAGRSQISHNKFIKNIERSTREFIDYLHKRSFKYNFLGFVAS